MSHTNYASSYKLSVNQLSWLSSGPSTPSSFPFPGWKEKQAPEKVGLQQLPCCCSSRRLRERGFAAERNFPERKPCRGSHHLQRKPHSGYMENHVLSSWFFSDFFRFLSEILSKGESLVRTLLTAHAASAAWDPLSGNKENLLQLLPKPTKLPFKSCSNKNFLLEQYI